MGSTACKSLHVKDVNEFVKEINTLGQYIADLNREIARSEVAGETANELRDKRQVALEDLAELVDIDAFYNTKRIHGYCGYRSPIAYENLYYMRHPESMGIAA